MVIPQEFYRDVCRLMPIPCIDLLVTDEVGRILLLKRKNEPMRNRWWFPGGRILFHETRVQAVIRKLKEECNLESNQITELGTFDLFFDTMHENLPGHAITTLFHVLVLNTNDLSLDHQSACAKWYHREKWLEKKLNPFIREHLLQFNKKGRNEDNKT